MAGFQNDSNLKEILFADNVDFTGGATPTGQMTTNGQLLIGSSVAPNIRVGTLTSSDGSIGFTTGPGTISAQVLNYPKDLHVAALIVNQTPNSGGNFTTIQSAINNALSGQTIFIYPGTYTENITLKAGVNLTAFGCDSSLNGTGTVIINGTCTMTTAGSVTISGIQLQTNSANFLAVTGSAASVVNLNNCFLNCSNNTGITFSSSSSSATINIYFCTGNLATTGITYFTNTSAGTINVNHSILNNTGSATTASTSSAGNIQMFDSVFGAVLSFSSAATFNSFVGTSLGTAALNAACITTAGTSSGSCINCQLTGGTASAVSIGVGTTVSLYDCQVYSSNTNAITGAGTVNYQGLNFTNTSSTINVTTQTVVGTLQGSKNTAPTAGFLGEEIKASAQTVTLLNGTPKTITSITLTPGVWSISAIGTAQNSGVSSQQGVFAISTTTNSFAGCVEGDTQLTFATGTASMSQIPLSIPDFKVVITTSTTYYAVMQINFSAGAGAGNARITGIRVG